MTINEKPPKREQFDLDQTEQGKALIKSRELRKN